jgi:hypothetical protein
MDDVQREEFTATMGDTVRLELRVQSRSHIELIRVRFTGQVGPPVLGTAHLATEGAVLNYATDATGNNVRSNEAVLLIDTNAAQAPGEYVLDELEVLTAGGRWLPVADYPPTFLNIEPEPEDDAPTYEYMVFSPYQPVDALSE